MSEYKKNNDGVHVMNGEFTICGDAFDCNIDWPELGEMTETKSVIVTCERCIDVVLLCRRVKTARRAPSQGKEK
mgnify:FL=1